jgi:hypothetical protein
MSDVNEALRDAGYIAVGLGVLGIHKAQVRRRDMARTATDRAALTARIDDARELLAELIKVMDERLVPVRQELEDRLEDVEGRLPDPARELVRSVWLKARDAERHMRKLAGVA